MPVMTRNMVDLKDEILTKIEEKFNDFKIVIITDYYEIMIRLNKRFLKLSKRELGKAKNWNPLFVCFRNM